MRSPSCSRPSLALPVLALLAACSSAPATHAPTRMLPGCAVSAAEYPPCEPAALYYPGAVYPYGPGYLYPGVVLVPVVVPPPAPPPAPPPVTPPPVPKPPPPAPKPHKGFRQHPGRPKEPCRVVNGHRVCP